MEQKLLTLREVAEFLRVTTRTVRNWQRDGFLPPPIMLRKSPRWDEDELRRWMRK
jgi:excisionase family DNA binding protein